MAQQLPDLARARAFADRLRTADDSAAADLLASDEGQWFFAEATPYTDRETRTRIVKLITGTVPAALVKEIFTRGPKVTP